MESIIYLQHAPFLTFTKDFINSKQSSQDAPLHILEVGCGTGEFAHLLKCHYQHAIDLTAIDPSQQAIQAAKSKTKDVSFINSGLLEWRNPDTKYDIIICTKSLHHCGDLQKTVQRVYELLKNEGTLLAEELQPDKMDSPSISWLFDRLDLLTRARYLNADGLRPPHSTLADPTIPAEERWNSFLEKRSCHSPHDVKEAIKSVFGKDQARILEKTAFMHYYLPKFRLEDSEVGKSILVEFMAQEARALANGTITSLGFNIIALKSDNHIK
ncbi:S-adenosyl-L-methionine-dependent methyltransferase [Chlamydoabsidia padenii]|nr:S-adenosyl-L-methionine-dependent methyltransferase [Chlamydoabsidia padenii]